jgi:hypothetical protein
MIADRSAHPASVKVAKDPGERCCISGSQISVANRWNNQVSDQGVGVSYCLLDTASIRSVSDIQFRGN